MEPDETTLIKKVEKGVDELLIVLYESIKIFCVNDQRHTGKYTVQFDVSSLASGMYVYQLRVNEYTSTKKMLLIK